MPHLFWYILIWNTICSVIIMVYGDPKKVEPLPILFIGVLLGFPLAALVTIIKQQRD